MNLAHDDKDHHDALVGQIHDGPHARQKAARPRARAGRLVALRLGAAREQGMQHWVDVLKQQPERLPCAAGLGGQGLPRPPGRVASVTRHAGQGQLMRWALGHRGSTCSLCSGPRRSPLAMSACTAVRCRSPTTPCSSDNPADPSIQPLLHCRCSMICFNHKEQRICARRSRHSTSRQASLTGMHCSCIAPRY